ncbi:hypothetical protein [Ruegeria lacuscaerulensis]|uniref:hypothetical protein n=1 Tax=Ruegeria lacuscaerulensis TaxID=55218 RepID=UPI001480017B|nr:hypothetical protein [Ruegeria lacuscaerulensis]
MIPFTYTCRNRSPRTVIILICIYAALLALVIQFDAAWWLMGLLALATLPALWDVARNTSAGLVLDQGKIRWFSGTREAELSLSEIDHVRFDTRWDLSVRLSLVLKSGKRVRLPDESTPPHRDFEPILQMAGLRVSRHHFTVF